MNAKINTKNTPNPAPEDPLGSTDMHQEKKSLANEKVPNTPQQNR